VDIARRTFKEVLAQARSGEVAPARVAALFGVAEDTLRRLAMRCYPLTLPDDALKIAARQAVAALEDTAEPDFESAVRRLKADPQALQFVRLLLQTQD
jgi:hypothetical protein